MNIFENEKYLQAVRKIAGRLSGKKGNVLITGATGLIGSLLTDVLIYADREFGCGFKVYALSRSEEKLRKRFAYADKKEIEFVAQDVSEPLDKALELDYIVHLASNADPRSYSLYPAQTLMTNINGALGVLEYAREHQNTRILFSSTFEVYGKIENCDVYKEDMCGIVDFNAVRSCYPESKRCAEILFRCYAQEYGVDFVIARLCSIYGPTMSMSDSKAHAQFIKNALNNENIVLKSEGKPRRTYLSVFDTVSAMIKIMLDGKSGEAYNVSSEKSIVSIAEVAKAAAGIAGTEVIFDLPDEIEKRGFSAPQNCILDSKKLSMLGWQADYDLNSGLELTINILKDLQNN